MVAKTRAGKMVRVPFLDEALQGTQNRFSLPASFSERKGAFLHNLMSPSDKAKYKRYTGAPIRYAGGKSLAVGLIVERIPDDLERIIPPFLGGGSVEVACAVELGLPVIAFDIFDILITCWKVQLREPKELYERLLKFAPTVDEFRDVKERLKAHWTGKLPLDTALDIWGGPTQLDRGEAEIREGPAMPL